MSQYFSSYSALTPPTHYGILGVPLQASKEEIRAAYKGKALELHPDKNPHGEDLFKVVVNAYQTLNSPGRRRAYDRMLNTKTCSNEVGSGKWRRYEEDVAPTPTMYRKPPMYTTASMPTQRHSPPSPSQGRRANKPFRQRDYPRNFFNRGNNGNSNKSKSYSNYYHSEYNDHEDSRRSSSPLTPPTDSSIPPPPPPRPAPCRHTDTTMASHMRFREAYEHFCKQMSAHPQATAAFPFLPATSVAPSSSSQRTKENKSGISISDGISPIPPLPFTLPPLSTQYSPFPQAAWTPAAATYGGFNLASWFHKNQTELNEGEKELCVKAAYHARLSEEERQHTVARHQEREAERTIQRASELLLAQREYDHLREESFSASREAEKKEAMERAQKIAEVQLLEQQSLEDHLAELRCEKLALATREGAIRKEKEDLQQTAVDLEPSRKSRESLRQLELQNEIAAAEARLTFVAAERKTSAAVAAARAERLRAEEAESDRRMHELQAQMEAAEAERILMEKEAALRRQKKVQLVVEERKKVMENILRERRMHEDEVDKMKRETDRIEAGMRAKLDALRKAKREGKVINLEEFKLEG